MSLNCFFGMELHPDDATISPVIPPKSKLVITHCSITATHTVESPTSSSSFKEGGAASSSSGAPGEEQVRLLDGAVTLYVQGRTIPKPFAVCTLSLLQGITYAPLELIFEQEVHLTLRRASGGACGPNVAYPRVHLTGYYEEDEGSESESENESEAESEEEEMEEEEAEEAAASGGDSRRRRTQAKTISGVRSMRLPPPPAQTISCGKTLDTCDTLVTSHTRDNQRGMPEECTFGTNWASKVDARRSSISIYVLFLSTSLSLSQTQNNCRRPLPYLYTKLFQMVRTVLCSTELQCPLSSPPRSGSWNKTWRTPETAATETQRLRIRYPVGSSTLQLSGVHIQLSLPPRLERDETSGPHHTASAEEKEDDAQQRARLQQLVRVRLHAVVVPATTTGTAAPPPTPSKRFLLGIIFLPLPSPSAATVAGSAPSAPLSLPKKSTRFNPFQVAPSSPPPPDGKKTKAGKNEGRSKGKEEEGAMANSSSASNSATLATTLFQLGLPPFLAASAHFMPLDLRVQMERIELLVEATVVDTKQTFPYVLPRLFGKRRREEALEALRDSRDAGERAKWAAMEKERREGKRLAHAAREAQSRATESHHHTRHEEARNVLVKISVVGSASSLAVHSVRVKQPKERERTDNRLCRLKINNYGTLSNNSKAKNKHKRNALSSFSSEVRSARQSTSGILSLSLPSLSSFLFIYLLKRRLLLACPTFCARFFFNPSSPPLAVHSSSLTLSTTTTTTGFAPLHRQASSSSTQSVGEERNKRISISSYTSFFFSFFIASFCASHDSGSFPVHSRESSGTAAHGHPPPGSTTTTNNQHGSPSSSFSSSHPPLPPTSSRLVVPTKMSHRELVDLVQHLNGKIKEKNDTIKSLREVIESFVCHDPEPVKQQGGGGITTSTAAPKPTAAPSPQPANSGSGSTHMHGAAADHSGSTAFLPPTNSPSSTATGKPALHPPSPNININNHHSGGGGVSGWIFDQLFSTHDAPLAASGAGGGLPTHSSSSSSIAITSHADGGPPLGVGPARRSSANTAATAADPEAINAQLLRCVTQISSLEGEVERCQKAVAERDERIGQLQSERDQWRTEAIAAQAETEALKEMIMESKEERAKANNTNTNTNASSSSSSSSKNTKHHDVGPRVPSPPSLGSCDEAPPLPRRRSTQRPDQMSSAAVAAAAAAFTSSNAAAAEEDEEEEEVPGPRGVPSTQSPRLRSQPDPKVEKDGAEAVEFECQTNLQTNFTPAATHTRTDDGPEGVAPVERRDAWTLTPGPSPPAVIIVSTQTPQRASSSRSTATQEENTVARTDPSVESKGASEPQHKGRSTEELNETASLACTPLEAQKNSPSVSPAPPLPNPGAGALRSHMPPCTHRGESVESAGGTSASSCSSLWSGGGGGVTAVDEERFIAYAAELGLQFQELFQECHALKEQNVELVRRLEGLRRFKTTVLREHMTPTRHGTAYGTIYDVCAGPQMIALVVLPTEKHLEETTTTT
eukprot:gene2223-1386_t